MKSCPICNKTLTPLNLKVSSHGSLVIDHCYFCGSVWFDHYEINRLPLIQAKKLTSMGQFKLNHDKPSHKEPHCPNDNQLLVQVNSETIPPNTILLQCPLCKGNLISKEELLTLKKAQKIKLEYFKTWSIPIPALSSFIIPAVFILIVSAGVFLTVQKTQESSETRIKAKETIQTPIVTYQNSYTVTIAFTTTIPATSLVTIQPALSQEQRTVPVTTTKSTIHLAKVTDLKPNTTYYFKITIEEAPGISLTSETYTFTTK